MLDFTKLLSDDGARLGLSLLAAASPTVRPAGFGERLAQGVGMFDQWKQGRDDAKSKESQRAMQARLIDMQLQQALAQQAAAKRAQEQQAIDEGLIRGQAQGLGPGGMGPAAPDPQFDPRAFMGGGGSLGGLQQLLGVQRALNPAEEAYTLAPGARRYLGGREVAANPVEQKLDAMIVTGTDGKPMVNPLWVQAKKATQAPGTVVNVGAGQKDANWGTPPKDYVWARDAAGNVMTERDPGSGAFRPIATPIGGSKDERAVSTEKRQAADKAARAYTTIDQMLKHPGLDTAVGLSGQIDPRNYLWGNESQGALALIKQAQGQAFLQAFESLKGGGQITQIEGEKATDAMARLQRAQSDKDFRAAAEELKQIAARAYERATGKRITEGPTLAPMGDASLDDLLKKYGN
jgi:hypothetical protein